jgi:hypothetical protein
MNTIIKNPLKYNHSEHVFSSTQIERKRRQDNGINELSVTELNEALLNLGFKISNPDSFTYTNSMNLVTYKARSCYIIDIKTKLSFAHVDFIASQPERLKQLQEFRYNNYAYCFKSHTIYDI